MITAARKETALDGSQCFGKTMPLRLNLVPSLKSSSPSASARFKIGLQVGFSTRACHSSVRMEFLVGTGFAAQILTISDGPVFQLKTAIGISHYCFLYDNPGHSGPLAPGGLNEGREWEVGWNWEWVVHLRRTDGADANGS